MRIHKMLVPFCLSLLAGTGAGAAVPQYTIVDLGPLSPDTAAATFGISAGGVVAGRSSISGAGTTPGSTAFTWSQQDGMKVLPKLAGRSFAVANAANDAGSAVGVGMSTLTGAGVPLMWQNGQISQLALPGPYTTGKATDVNGSNVAVGSVGATTEERAVIYANGGVTLLPLTAGGARMVAAHAVNDSGWVVGYGNDLSDSQLRVGLVYDIQSNTSFSLGTLAGKNGAIAYDVSQGGTVVGAALTGSGGAVPFYWTQARGMQAIPMLAGLTIGTARSVNASAWVVGNMGVGTTTPFLYDGNSSYALADLLAAGSGWTITSSVSNAYGISDSGVITGVAILNGVSHAYAMIPTAPVPEPSSYALLLSGLGFVSVWARKRR